ncbi:MAG: hypothetical protein H0U85_05550, partial [Gemmatimonadales bacterium]|nr:hypothetical protein [Gemmatimonadales bacterium]
MRYMLSAAAFLAATAAPAQAQDACSYRTTPAVGSWARYTMNRNGQDVTMRMAIVGQEKRNGKDALWFETKSETPRGTMINAVLVPGFPFEPGDVK